jgi:hypothetical protein
MRAGYCADVTGPVILCPFASILACRAPRFSSSFKSNIGPYAICTVRSRVISEA